ncbi:hypothetical protein S101447_03144 (plasmid) [Acetobacter ascendens]|uniref:Uncharacterized protein n=1 Tax=Acetobacter ascendens TaxID=481146 RepID=A0A1Y0V287_9PROT|nr:hypothetical protein S101447_02950 [Acetobacter ascendens]ARW12181.1 hypothetical protein S101447_03144 [Acetobacter ascendens]
MPNLSFAETDQKNSPIICDDAIVRVHRSGIIDAEISQKGCTSG